LHISHSIFSHESLLSFSQIGNITLDFGAVQNSEFDLYLLYFFFKFLGFLAVLIPFSNIIGLETQILRLTRLNAISFHLLYYFFKFCNLSELIFN